MNKYRQRRRKIHVLQAVVRYSARSFFASWGEMVSMLKAGMLGNPSASKEMLRDVGTALGASDSIFQIMPTRRWPDMWPNFQCVANLSNCIMYVYSFQFNGRSLLCCSVPLDFARKLTSRNSSCLGISPHEPPAREARPRRFRRC